MPQTAANGQYTGSYELDFEKPLVKLEQQIANLESHADDAGVDFDDEIRTLREKYTSMLKKTYASLGAWNTVRVARHPGRPGRPPETGCCPKQRFANIVFSQKSQHENVLSFSYGIST